MVGVSGVVGLNYQSLEFLFKIYKTKDRRAIFESIREIETGALEAMRKERPAKRGT